MTVDPWARGAIDPGDHKDTDTKSRDDDGGFSRPTTEYVVLRHPKPKEENIALRKEVTDFAAAMEKELRNNDHKGGWQDCSPHWLIGRLCQEVIEVIDQIQWDAPVDGDRRVELDALRRKFIRDSIVATRSHLAAAASELLRYSHIRDYPPMKNQDGSGLVGETADVANFAMMIADVCVEKNKAKPNKVEP
jgi:hypothetical protein